MNPYYLNGSSSLLFMISTAKAIKCSKLFWWKFFNGQLVVASFLCNANEYKNPYLLLDYGTLFLINTSYINNYRINRFLFFLLGLEYYYKNSIENTKNLSFIAVTLYSLANTYLYGDSYSFYSLIGSTISGSVIYYLRYYLNKNNCRKYNLLLTYLFHFSMMNSLCISSITASSEKQFLIKSMDPLKIIG